MTPRHLTACIATVAATGLVAVAFGLRTPITAAQAPPARSTSTDLNGFLAVTLLFSAADTNKDGAVSRGELVSTFGRWIDTADAAKTGAVNADQLLTALNGAMPASSLAAAFNMGGRGGQPQTPDPLTVAPMMAALPAAAPAKPARPRKVLVLGKAGGFVHSSIPLAAKTIEALGTKTGAWTTTISFDAADINTENLKQYDAVFLASTTGAFLDEPTDPAATTARRQALLDFVRGGKGLAGIHAATDSYHANAPAPDAGRAGGARAGGGGNPLAGLNPVPALVPAMMSHGDRNRDGKLTRAEAEALAGSWFTAIDAKKSGALIQSDFALLALYVPKTSGPAAATGPDRQTGTWPEFNTMIGGYFKYHWLDPQQITMKVDDPASPLTSMFKGAPPVVHDEIYTMGINSWSRENVRVLTSIDTTKMSAEDRALEDNPRADGDYGLSWIRREGQGRVFYEALGHSERIYANRAILEHLVAGMQYVLGDLKADDSPVRR